MVSEEKKKFNFPDSLVIIFAIIFIAQLLTYFIPPGSFERAAKVEGGPEMVVAGSYQQLVPGTTEPLAPWAFLAAIPQGMESAQEIIFLVLITGGVIALLKASGAIDSMLFGAVKRFSANPALLIGGTLFLFGVGTFTIGLAEEYIALAPLLLAMCLALKLDAVVAMGILWGGFAIGWATAGINPFGVLIAQNIAGVPATSGLSFRMVLFAIFLAIGFHHIYRYAKLIKADPSKSLVAHVDYSIGHEELANIPMTLGRRAIILIFTAGICLFVYGAQTDGWFIQELNVIFLLTGLATILISRMAVNDAARTFLSGAADMTSAALIIGFARSIEVILSQGQIIDTIINSIASILQGYSAHVAAIGMLFVQSVTNLFIPSGSGQALVTMPIMSPLAELTGVPQQTAVLAYQFGDGLTNLIVPTSGLVMAGLALSRVPYMQWVRFIAPLLGKLLFASLLAIIFSVQFPQMI